MIAHEFKVGDDRYIFNVDQITEAEHQQASPYYKNGVTTVKLSDGKEYRFEGSNNEQLYDALVKKMCKSDAITGSLSPWRDWMRDPPENIEMKQIVVFYWDEGGADEQDPQGTPGYETLFFDGQQWADNWCKFDDYDRILYWMPVDPPTCAKEWRKKRDL